MSIIYGVTGATLASALMWRAASIGVTGLPAGQHRPIELILVLMAAALGFLIGAAVGHRRRKERQMLFGTTAGAAAGALCGAAYALAMVLAYVHTYGGAPSGAMDAALLMLSYPVFAVIGAFIGAALGALIGAAGGLATRRW